MAKKEKAKTVWGTWFVNVLETSFEHDRLKRGWTYANNDLVRELVVKGSTVTAIVLGNYQYHVEIKFPEIREKEKIYALIEDNPMFLSQVQVGVLPAELVDELKAHEISLMPSSWKTIKSFCTCPDWGDPCKHRAAVYYILAQYIDNDPFVLFELRGVTLKERFPSGGTAQFRESGALFCIYEKIKIAKKNGGQPEENPWPLSATQYTGIIQALLPPLAPWAEAGFSADFMALYHAAAGKPHVALEADEKTFTDFIKSYYFFTKTDTTLQPLYANIPEEGHREHRFAEAKWNATMRLERGQLCSFVMTDRKGQTYTVTMPEILYYFLSFSSSEGSPAYRFLFYFARFIRALWKSGAFVPRASFDTRYLGVYWVPFLTMPDVQKAMADLERYETGMLTKGKKTVAGESALYIFAAEALTELVRTYAAHPRLKVTQTDHIRAMFFHGIHYKVDTIKLHHIPEAVQKWLAPFSIDFTRYRYRFVIRAMRVKDNSAAKKNSEKKMQDKMQSVVQADTQSKEESLRDALRQIETEFTEFRLSLETAVGTEFCSLRSAVEKTKNYSLLAVPQALSNYIPEILELGKRDFLFIDDVRLADFFDNAYNLLLELGVDVVLPKAIHKAIRPRFVIEAKPKKKAGNLVSYLNLETITAFNWKIALGETLLSYDEFKKLVAEQGRVVKFKEGWVILDPKDVAIILKQGKDHKAPSTLDFLKFYCSGAIHAPEFVKKKLDSIFSSQDSPLPTELNATLRPYQENGYRWAYSLLRAGIGAILADDMGLGKTVQAIAVLLRLKEEGLMDKAGALILAPAALLANWEAELARFAPSFAVSRYHGQGRELDEKSDVYITTYQTAVRDAEFLVNHGFSVIIADEAHVMKNPDTAIACTAKAIPARFRMALSGTPVENRLEDLRSLFDFVLPGYLGGPAEFKTKFRVPIEVERNEEVAVQLKKITAPFLLRRLKTDKAIIGDLPSKVEIDEYATLTKRQAALYEAVTRQALKAAEQEEDKFARSAIILKLLTNLKQICDHPRVYDKESPAKSELSGKSVLLLELLTTLLAGNEKILVFSQYVEALEVLRAVLEQELDEEPLIYHGSLGQKARENTVAEFQNGRARLMLVSLKAGGLGLNLTAASRVIHYDLWFNPAVEAQASDRAYRIGQTKNVFVHRLITKNTFEEQINQILISKKELAELTVATGESWITRMSPEELEHIFTLRM